MTGTYSIKKVLSNKEHKFSCMVSFNDKPEEFYEVDFDVLGRAIKSSNDTRGTLQKQLDAKLEDLAKAQDWLTKVKEALKVATKEKDKETKDILEERKVQLEARIERTEKEIKSVEIQMQNLEAHCDDLREKIASRTTHLDLILQEAADADAEFVESQKELSEIKLTKGGKIVTK